MTERRGLRTLDFSTKPKSEDTPKNTEEMARVPEPAVTEQPKEKPLSLSERKFRLAKLGSIKGSVEHVEAATPAEHEEPDDIKALRSGLGSLYEQAIADTAKREELPDIQLATTEGIEIPDSMDKTVPQLHADVVTATSPQSRPKLVFGEDGVMHEVPAAEPLPELHAEDSTKPPVEPLPELRIDDSPTSRAEPLPELHADDTPKQHAESLPELHSATDDTAGDPFAEENSPTSTDKSASPIAEEEVPAPPPVSINKDTTPPTFEVSPDAKPFNVPDEEVLDAVGKSTPEEVRIHEDALFASLFGSTSEEDDDASDSLEAVVLQEGYSPFRAKKGRQAVEVLLKAQDLQDACDTVNASNVVNSAASTVGNAWNSSVGKVIKGANPKDWMDNTSKNSAIKKYQKLGDIPQVRVQVMNDLRKTHTVMAHLPSRKRVPKTFNNGTAACAVVLLQSISSKCGCVGVKVDRTEDAWEASEQIAAVVSMDTFGGVYLLFRSVDEAQQYRKFFAEVFDTSLVNIETIREQHRADVEESLEGAGIRGGTVHPASAPVAVATSASATIGAEVEEAEPVEPSTDTKDTKGSTEESRRDYQPFKPEMLEQAIQALQDAKVYQEYEDYKGQPHGIKGFINSFREDSALVQSGQGMNGGYNTYGGYGTQYGRGSQQAQPKTRLGAIRMQASAMVQNTRAALNRGKENRIADCGDFDKLLAMQRKCMRHISPALARKFRNGTSTAPVHVNGLGTLFACKILTFTLSKDSGVREVVMGPAATSGGYAVAIPDFDGLRCVFKEQDDAESFIDYMADWFYCEPDTGVYTSTRYSGTYRGATMGQHVVGPYGNRYPYNR